MKLKIQDNGKSMKIKFKYKSYTFYIVVLRTQVYMLEGMEFKVAKKKKRLNFQLIYGSISALYRKNPYKPVHTDGKKYRFSEIKSGNTGQCVVQFPVYV